MALVTVSDTILTDIADAIRAKNGTENTYKPSDMPDAIEAISGGGSSALGTKTITTNGTYEAEDDSLEGYSEVTVSVSNTYTAGDEGKVVSSGALVSQSSDTVTTNDTYDTTLINSLTVNVSGSGGTPGTEFLWADGTNQVVTIGANSVSNTQAVYDYFSASYSFKFILLLSELTVNNQFVSYANGSYTRYRNGTISGTSAGASYDAKLVEGSQYLLLSD